MIIHHDYYDYHGHVHDGYHRNDQTVDRWDDDQHHSQHHHRNNDYLWCTYFHFHQNFLKTFKITKTFTESSPKLSKNFHFQKTSATIVGRIRWDLGRMFLNGVHNSKQSRAPCTKSTKKSKNTKN